MWSLMRRSEIGRPTCRHAASARHPQLDLVVADEPTAAVERAVVLHQAARARRVALRSLAVLTCAVMGGCAANRSDVAAVRIGGVALTSQRISHWAALLADEPAEPGVTPRIKALRFLVSAEWVVREAARRGMPVTGRDVTERMRERGVLGSSGAGLAAVMRWSGRSLRDLRYETAAELASRRLRSYVAREERIAARIAPAEVRRYYRHDSEFVHRELRTFNIVEYLRTPAAARKVMAEVERGRRISSIALHEARERPAGPAERGDPNGKIHAAIFRAPLHRLVGPLPLNFLYAFFEVTHITPAGRSPLTQVRRRMIERRLGDVARERVKAAFVRAWFERWHARTICRPEYMMQLCRQRHEARTSIDPFSIG
jgi:PPIC-type PPIASE domain